MDLKARLFILTLSLILLGFVLNLVRKKRIRIEYSILWLFVSFIIVLVSIWSDLADQLAYFMGIYYPPALFFLIAIIFFILLMLHFSIEMTRMKDQIKTIVQELSLLKNQVHRMNEILKLKNPETEQKEKNSQR